MSFSFHMLNQPAPDPTYKPLVPDAPDYYQVNHHGMKILWNILSAGSLLDEECEMPDFDSTIPEWMDQDRLEEIMDAIEFGDEPDPPMTDEEREAIEAAKQAQDSLVRIQSPHPGKIPAFKFGSNDGWMVSPEECHAINSVISSIKSNPDKLSEVCPTDESKAVLESWGEFVRIAETAGGFIVS